jgi:hypothetical protein
MPQNTLLKSDIVEFSIRYFNRLKNIEIAMVGIEELKNRG